MQPRVPVRTCVGTGKKLPRHALLRVAADPGDRNRIVPDPACRIPGRGAWLTPSLEAYEKAVRRRAFARALRVPVQADTSRVRGYLVALAERQDMKRKSTT